MVLSFLYFLINAEKYVSIPIHKTIIVNWMGDASGVAKMFNSLCSNVMVSYISEKYCSPYEYLLNSIKILANKHRTIFYHEYFNT